MLYIKLGINAVILRKIKDDMEKENIVHLDNIDAYNKIYGIETKHPLVTVVDFDTVKS